MALVTLKFKNSTSSLLTLPNLTYTENNVYIFRKMIWEIFLLLDSNSFAVSKAGIVPYDSGIFLEVFSEEKNQIFVSIVMRDSVLEIKETLQQEVIDLGDYIK